MQGPQDANRSLSATDERLLGLLGLARRAGKLAMGASAVEAMVRAGDKPLVILVHDGSPNQRRRWLTLHPVRGFVKDRLSRADLGQRLGRNDLTIVAVADSGFVRGIMELGVVSSFGVVAESRKDSATSR